MKLPLCRQRLTSPPLPKRRNHPKPPPNPQNHRVEIATKDNPKSKLKADETNGVISLEDNTQLTAVPAIA